MPKPILHGIEMSAPCRLVLATAKIIGLDLEWKAVDFFTGEHKSESYLKMNPVGTVPTLDDNGLHLWESRAVMLYLIQKYASDKSLYPSDIQARAQIDNILFFDDSGLYPKLGEYCYPQILFGQPAPADKEKPMKDRLSVLETILTKQPYLAGKHLTAADLSVLNTLSLLQVCEYDFSPYPHLTKWISKVNSELPQYAEVTKNGIKQQADYLKSHSK